MKIKSIGKTPCGKWVTWTWTEPEDDAIVHTRQVRIEAISTLYLAEGQKLVDVKARPRGAPHEGARPTKWVKTFDVHVGIAGMQADDTGFIVEFRDRHRATDFMHICRGGQSFYTGMEEQ